jgi:hypothetical protein
LTGSFAFAQQLRQLRDVRRDPPRLIAVQKGEERRMSTFYVLGFRFFV